MKRFSSVWLKSIRDSSRFWRINSNL